MTATMTTSTTSRSDIEIQSEIDQLASIKDKVRVRSMFGDDNRQAIAAQIKVLQQRMTRDQIEAEFGDDGLEEGYSESIHMAAVDAFEWYQGLSDEVAPSESWAPLVQ